MPIEINGKVYRNIQEQVKENQDNIADLQDDVDHIQYLIDSGQIGISVAIVEELPTEDINPQCIYMIASDNPDEDNIYYEYMYIDNAWEMIGSTATDLTDYYTKTETDTAINNAKQIYVCTYGTTTYAEIAAAVAQDKIPVVSYGSPASIYPLTTLSGSQAIFMCLGYSSSKYNARRIACSSSNTWSNSSTTIGEKELFWATYGTTTNAQITTALSNGQLPVCYYNDRMYVYSQLNSGYHMFITIYYDVSYYARVNASNVWDSNSLTIERASRKVNSIDGVGNTSNYPSTKAVYDFGTSLMTPSVSAYNIVNNIGEAQFTFTDNVFNASNNKWLGTFTMGNCFFMIPLYGLTQGTTYKTNGTFVYSSLGEVVSTTINYKITNNTTITVWSGNSNFTMQEGYTAYLSLLRLF